MMSCTDGSPVVHSFHGQHGKRFDDTLGRGSRGYDQCIGTVLSDEKILFLLDHSGELPVNSIAEALGMQQSTISQQLKLLRASRLVRHRKEGRSIHYSLNDDHIATILTLGVEHYEEILG